MAKRVWTINRNIEDTKKIVKNAVLKSISADLEDEEVTSSEHFINVFQVYERYSWASNNRLSLSVNMISEPNSNVTKVTAISAGGSTAMFLKINSIGEHSFLNSLDDELFKYTK